jgi:hypothetical protein
MTTDSQMYTAYLGSCTIKATYFKIYTKLDTKVRTILEPPDLIHREAAQ